MSELSYPRPEGVAAGTDIAYLPSIRTARDEYVDTANPPASTAVQVTALFSPDALLEVEAYAVI